MEFLLQFFNGQNGDGVISFVEADVDGVSDGLPNTRLYLSPRAFNRFAVTREIDDGLLARASLPSNVHTS